MKNRKCPNHKACWDYGGCETCELGNEITRLHKRIDRLKKQNETLTIQKNDWERLARFYEAHEPNKWISVDERLPKEYETVLVYGMGLISSDYLTSRGRWYNHEIITHWQPLPTPPKESEDTE